MFISCSDCSSAEIRKWLPLVVLNNLWIETIKTISDMRTTAPYGLNAENKFQYIVLSMIVSNNRECSSSKCSLSYKCKLRDAPTLPPYAKDICRYRMPYCVDLIEINKTILCTRNCFGAKNWVSGRPWLRNTEFYHDIDEETWCASVMSGCADASLENII